MSLPVVNPLALDAVVLVLGLFVLLMEAFDSDKEKSFLGWISVWGIGTIFILSFFAVPVDFAKTSQVAHFYAADSFALFYKRIALGSTLLILIMALEFRPILAKYIPAASRNAGLGEFFALPVFTCFGLMLMASAIDFIMIFIALELVTISFYVLVSYMRKSISSLEAGVKYLILGALSTGFLVYGITWIFGITGKTNLIEIARVLQTLPESANTALLFGAGLILVGLGFKIAAAPFQLWVPDVYQGAPTPITAYLSVASKAAGFIVLMRVVGYFVASPILQAKLLVVIGILAGITLIYGNLAALPQENFKRLLGYSSIAHAGYLLVALACWKEGVTGITISVYLAAYLLMTMLSFLILVVVQKNTGGDNFTNFNGLARRSRILTLGMVIASASLAGVPLTVGFVGKLLVFRDAIQAERWGLIAISVLAVGAGFYYYFKVIRAMFWTLPEQPERIPVAPTVRVTIGLLSLLIILLGIYPQPVMSLIGR